MPELQPPKPEAASTPSVHIGFRRFSTAEFLVALVLLFVATPFVEDMRYGNSIEISLMTLVLVSGVLAVGRNRRTLVWAAALVVPAITARWIHHFFPERVSAAVIFLVAALVYLIFLVVQFLRFILRAPRVNAEVMCAGISVYLLLGLAWTLAYLLVAALADPQHPAFAFNAGPASIQSLTSFNAYYFSFVTLTTVGYGDITPVSNGARALAAMEAMTGTLYVAVLISRLVALYSSQGSQLREPQP